MYQGMYQRKTIRGPRLKRTQISLAPEEHQLVREMADRKGVSMSQIIREAIRRYGMDQKSDDPWERLLDIVGIGESGNARSSVDHDAVIHG